MTPKNKEEDKKRSKKWNRGRIDIKGDSKDRNRD